MLTIVDKIRQNQIGSDAKWLFPAESLELNFAQLIALSELYAHGLCRIGIKPGDRVGLILVNSSTYVALLLAIWRLNAIAVPLRSIGNKYTQAEHYLANFDSICEFNMLFYDEEGTSRAFINSWLANSANLSDQIAQAMSLRDFISYAENTKPITADAAFPSSTPMRDDIAVLQFSSGSTGNPKGVIVTHGMIIDQLNNIDYNHASIRGFNAIASCASWMPLNHDMGLFIGVLLPIYTACNNLLAPPGFYMRNPARWFSLLATHKVDMSFTTNSALASTFHHITRNLDKSSTDLSRLHLYLSAEKISPIMFKKCLETFPGIGLPAENIHVGYGMAENALGCACTRNNTLRLKRFVIDEQRKLTPVKENISNSIELVSIGVADKEHEITIRDEIDQILGELELGEINIEGICVTPGYYKNPEQTRAAIFGHRFRSGDLGFIHEGIIYF
jgi:acyl-CoA synthetase (AMP-forming)/AMP-acid ligase II